MEGSAGVVLAGGSGSRLRPNTLVTNKHLLPIYDRPMCYFPIELLRDKFGIRDILIVSGGDHIGDFAELLGDGRKLGVNLTYRVQEEAGGIAQALGLAEDFVAGRHVVVVLGDNIFVDFERPQILDETVATLFAKKVEDPQRFGVPVFNPDGDLIRIDEKPDEPESDFAVTGLYSYPPDVFDIIPTLNPSGRGELEITDVNNWYIENKRCHLLEINGYWKDSGTHDSLLESSIRVAESKRLDSR